MASLLKMFLIVLLPFCQCTSVVSGCSYTTTECHTPEHLIITCDSAFTYTCTTNSVPSMFKK